MHKFGFITKLAFVNVHVKLQPLCVYLWINDSQLVWKSCSLCTKNEIYHRNLVTILTGEKVMVNQVLFIKMAMLVIMCQPHQSPIF